MRSRQSVLNIATRFLSTVRSMEIKEGIDRRQLRTGPMGHGDPERREASGSESPSSLAEFKDWEVDVSELESQGPTQGPVEDRGRQFTDSRPDQDSNTPSRSPRSARLVVSFFLLVVIAACSGVIWLSLFDAYTAETKLLFVSRPAASSPSAPWCVEQELELLKSPKMADRVVLAAAQKPESIAQFTQVSSCDPVRSGETMGSSPGKPEQSLLDSLSFRVEKWDQGGCVTIAIQGNDPHHLKSVLHSYTQQYLRSRQDLSSLVSKTSGPTRPSVASSENRGLLAVLDGELARRELIARNCELALDLMDTKGKSAGSLFPGAIVADLPALKTINDELVNLAIKRQHLTIRYQSSSPEIREVNQEIESFRKMMRQYLQQQVIFLRSGIQQLEALKRQNQAETRPASGESGMQARNQLCGITPASEEWVAVGPSVVVLPGTPTVVKQPLREELQRIKDRTLEYLFDRRNRPCPTDPSTVTASAHLACTPTTPIRALKCDENVKAIVSPVTDVTSTTPIRALRREECRQGSQPKLISNDSPGKQ